MRGCCAESDFSPRTRHSTRPRRSAAVASVARIAGHSRRRPPLRHAGPPTCVLCTLGWRADQLAPTHGRLCSDAGDASRRSLPSLARSASVSDVRWASCQSSRRGMAQRRGRRERPATLALTLVRSLGGLRAVARSWRKSYGARRFSPADNRPTRGTTRGARVSEANGRDVALEGRLASAAAASGRRTRASRRLVGARSRISRRECATARSRAEALQSRP